MQNHSQHLQRVVPNIWCNQNAETVGESIAAAFNTVWAGCASAHVTSRYPTEGLLPFQETLAGEPLTVDVTITAPEAAPYTLVLINAGDEFTPGTSISMMVNFDPAFFGASATEAREGLDRLWESMMQAGASALMPLGEYPFSARYGWASDAHGISWQLMLTSEEGEPRPFLMPSLLFGGAAQNFAEAAIDTYTTLLPASSRGTTARYAEQTGPATPGSLMFADFSIAGEWVTAMDGGGEREETFTPGFSLELRCDDQPQLDAVWNTLSAVPEAEVCGWLQDRFGVSWQITPVNLPELMQRPGAYAKLMAMKKIVIADF